MDMAALKTVGQEWDQTDTQDSAEYWPQHKTALLPHLTTALSCNNSWILALGPCVLAFTLLGRLFHNLQDGLTSMWYIYSPCRFFRF